MDVVTSQAGCAGVLQRILVEMSAAGYSQLTKLLCTADSGSRKCVIVRAVLYLAIPSGKEWCCADPFSLQVAGCRLPCLGNMLRLDHICRTEESM